MITVCLDESGKFEHVDYKKKIVGGVIYRGVDFDEERKHLEEFFKDQCKKHNISYPEGIHTTEMNKSIDGKKMKQDIGEELQIYLYENGKYHFTAIIKSKQNKACYSNVSNVLDDRYASNLYEHMICQLINNILFYNTNFECEKEVNLQIASRVSVVDKNDQQSMQQYEKLGHDQKEIKHGKAYMYFLLDETAFKTSIAMKMKDPQIKKKMHINRLDVDTINYKSTTNTTPFLYLADFVCDMIRDTFHVNAADFDIEKAYKEARKVTGNEPLYWVYDDIDEIWNELVTYFYNENFLECIHKIYDIQTSHSVFASYYHKYWTKKIYNRLQDIFKKDMICIYIAKLEYMFSKDKTQYKEGLFIGNVLWDHMHYYEQENNGTIDGKLKYRAADVLMRGYNHIGDIEKVQEFYLYCENLKKEADIEEYLETVNRIVQIHANEFDYDRAIERLSYSAESLDMLKNVKEEIAVLNEMENERAFRLPLIGKVLSSLGQMYAFKRELQKARGYFEDALREFEPSSKDRNVTLSYMLHLALDHQDRQLYDKYAKEYFESEDLIEQFQMIIASKKPDSFMLYVYMKTLYVLYGDMPNRLLDMVKTTDYKAKGFKTDSHPWQLIYKYLAFLLLRNKNMHSAEKMLKRGMECIAERGVTIRLINAYTLLEWYVHEDNEKACEKQIQEIRKLAQNSENIWKYFEDALDCENVLEIVRIMRKKFTFMYV